MVQTATGAKRKTVYGKTRAEAAAKLAKAIAESENGFAFDAAKTTVRAYLDSWLADSVRGNVRPGTFVRSETLVRLHIKPVLGRIRLAALSPAHVQALYRAKLDHGLSPTVVHRVHEVLHTALKLAAHTPQPMRRRERAPADQTRNTAVEPRSDASVLESRRRRSLRSVFRAGADRRPAARRIARAVLGCRRSGARARTCSAHAGKGRKRSGSRRTEDGQGPGRGADAQRRRNPEAPQGPTAGDLCLDCATEPATYNPTEGKVRKI